MSREVVGPSDEHDMAGRDLWPAEARSVQRLSGEVVSQSEDAVLIRSGNASISVSDAHGIPRVGESEDQVVVYVQDTRIAIRVDAGDEAIDGASLEGGLDVRTDGSHDDANPTTGDGPTVVIVDRTAGESVDSNAYQQRARVAVPWQDTEIELWTDRAASDGSTEGLSVADDVPAVAPTLSVVPTLDTAGETPTDQLLSQDGPSEEQATNGDPVGSLDIAATDVEDIHNDNPEETESAELEESEDWSWAKSVWDMPDEDDANVGTADPATIWDLPVVTEADPPDDEPASMPDLDRRSEEMIAVSASGEHENGPLPDGGETDPAGSEADAPDPIGVGIEHDQHEGLASVTTGRADDALIEDSPIDPAAAAQHAASQSRPRSVLRRIGIGLAVVVLLGGAIYGGSVLGSTLIGGSGTAAEDTTPSPSPGIVISTVEGNGPDTISSFSTREAWAIRWSSEGPGRFVVTTVDEDSTRTDVVSIESVDVPEEGSVEVTETGTFSIEVQAEGPWRLLVAEQSS